MSDTATYESVSESESVYCDKITFTAESDLPTVETTNHKEIQDCVSDTTHKDGNIYMVTKFPERPTVSLKEISGIEGIESITTVLKKGDMENVVSQLRQMVRNQAISHLKRTDNNFKKGYEHLLPRKIPLISTIFGSGIDEDKGAGLDYDDLDTDLQRQVDQLIRDPTDEFVKLSHVEAYFELKHELDSGSSIFEMAIEIDASESADSVERIKMRLHSCGFKIAERENMTDIPEIKITGSGIEELLPERVDEIIETST